MGSDIHPIILHSNKFRMVNVTKTSVLSFIIIGTFCHKHRNFDVENAVLFDM